MVFVAGFGDIDEMDLAKARKFDKNLNKMIKLNIQPKPKRQARLIKMPISGRRKFKGSLAATGGGSGYWQAVQQSEYYRRQMAKIKTKQEGKNEKNK